MRYRTDITAGSLKVTESRIIAKLLLDGVDDEGWRTALYVDNVDSTRTLKLRTVHIAQEVLACLRDRDEQYVLRSIQVAP